MREVNQNWPSENKSLNKRNCASVNEAKRIKKQLRAALLENTTVRNGVFAVDGESLRDCISKIIKGIST